MNHLQPFATTCNSSPQYATVGTKFYFLFIYFGTHKKWYKTLRNKLMCQ